MFEEEDVEYINTNCIHKTSVVKNVNITKIIMIAEYVNDIYHGILLYIIRIQKDFNIHTSRYLKIILLLNQFKGRVPDIFS